MADRFYVNCPLTLGLVTLHGPEAHHLATVCRLRPGATVCLFNGDGLEYPAIVREVARKNVSLEVTDQLAPRREAPFRLEIAAPLPKGDRAAFLIEKLTELGVTTYVPLRTARSVVHPGEGKREKLERAVIEASKQCGRNLLMAIQPIASWDQYCESPDLPRLRILAHRGGDWSAWPVQEDAACAVGPEGGWTDEEVRRAEQAGWKIAELGPRILRVETAALVLAARSQPDRS